ncbi:MAG: DUF5916 domain-containing protein [Saprospiraceae bacterium]|nr:carbohydrate binding family 9 domain-containing protein [Lewinella sp.]
MFRTITAIIILLATAPALRSQTQLTVPQNYSLPIRFTEETITLDGKLDEAVWQSADPATDFWKQSPIDNERAEQVTEVRMTYNEHFIFLAAICRDDPEYVIQTLKRDVSGTSDEFAVVFDPVKERTNGYYFSVNALGAQTEALISPSGLGLGAVALDESWDNKWQVAVQNYPDRWTVEMAIPFKTLRFKAGLPEWGINFVRIDPGSNEVHVWAPVPRQFENFDIGYLGQLQWDEAPSGNGKNISLIPYTRLSNFQNFRPTQSTKTEWAAGADAKVAITPTLNLDLTYNPDFSQVEVDAQVTNLTRFSIFFPEKRQFFLENADIFNEFGQGTDRPFYSRLIGLDRGGNPIPILYGLRLSGNLNPKTRLGLINMHTRGDNGRLGQNYSVVTFQQRLWERSSLKGIFLNRQAFDGGESQALDYGRNLGGEFNYSTPDGKWRTNLGYLHSFKEGYSQKNQHLYGRFDYDGQQFRTFLTVQHIGENYFADMGFNGRLQNYNPETGEIVRIGYTEFGNMLNYYIYPKNSKNVNIHWSGLENYVYINDGGRLNEWYTRLRHFLIFKNTSQLRFRLNNNYVRLIYPFAITETPLPADSYNMTEFNVQYNTDLRKAINMEVFAVYGQFYNGTKLTYRGSLSYRAQPWGNFTLGLENNHIRLPEPYGNVNLTLATARVEINFATNLFWTTFLQYNTQADNFNINSRFQWRFAPMSDLYLVYTDNYLIQGLFGPKDRTLVLKCNYWLTW